MTIFLVLLGLGTAHAEVSPLCTDLAKYACSPGSSKDGTGEVKSEQEVRKILSDYGNKAEVQLNQRFKQELQKPQNAYFRSVTLAALGLKNAPQCNSKKAEDQEACEAKAIEGLTTLAQKTALKPLMIRADVSRPGNLEDIRYILQNDVFVDVISDLNEQMRKDFNAPALEKRIDEEIVPQVKKQLVAKLEQLPIDRKQRKLMIDKIKGAKFKGTNCSELRDDAGSTEILSSLLVPDALYDSTPNIFKYCSGFLLHSSSEFNLVHTIAHEISHSVDPCSIAESPTDMDFKYSHPNNVSEMAKEYPIRNLISCLRNENSIHALNVSIEMEKQRANGKSRPPAEQYHGLRHERPALKHISIENSDSDYTPAPQGFCKGDQIPEAFADWLADEATPEYMQAKYKNTLTPEQYREGYANVFRVACQTGRKNSLNGFALHPPIEDRVNRLLLANPKIRAQMKCPAKHPNFIYCDGIHPAQEVSASRPKQQGGAQ